MEITILKLIDFLYVFVNYILMSTVSILYNRKQYSKYHNPLEVVIG